MLQTATTLRVVKGKRASFLYPQMLFSICFSELLGLLLVALVMAAVSVVFLHAKPEDIGKFFKLIAALDFDNRALHKVASARTGALTAAWALAAALVLTLPTAVFGLAAVIFQNRRTAVSAVTPLLPGKKGGFVPTNEGIYKLCYRSPFAGRKKFYFLYPWEALSLDALDEKRKRLRLKAGKAEMPLIPWDRAMFGQLRDIVLTRLPEGKRSPSAKRRRYRWGRAAVAVVAIALVMITLAGVLEGASSGKGSRYCDVGGDFHITHSTAFGPADAVMEVLGYDGKTIHTYCLVHSGCYLMLHPSTYVGTVLRMAEEGELAEIFQKFDMFALWVILPPLLWLCLLAVIAQAWMPWRTRMNVL
jgi:hypothetical protein